MIKTCRKCGIAKPAHIDFYKDGSRKDGLTPYCRECYAEYSARVALRSSAQKSDAYFANPNPAKARAAKRRQLKAAEISQHKRECYARLPDAIKTELQFKLKQWKSANPAKIAANCRARQARKIEACPIWLTKSQRDEILEFYSAAEALRKLFNVNFHVDHIVPLRSKTVCGLHVPWNLQLLSAADNVKKSNIYRIGTP